MPSVASLQQQQYYAHPQNAFWWIMQQLLGIDRALPYEQRIKRLPGHGIGLWDVLHACRRQGSLDSAIEHDSVQANDFAALLSAYPAVRAIFFNGKSVEQLFRRHVVRGQSFQPPVPLQTLPSTSPANARLRPADKCRQWRVILEHLPVDSTG